jgi:hypothetical protein
VPHRRGVDRQLRMEYDCLALEHLKHMPLTVHVRVPSCSGDASYTYTRPYYRNDGLSCTPKLAYYPYNEILVAYAKTSPGLLLLTGIEASLRSNSGNVGNPLFALGMDTKHASVAIETVSKRLESGESRCLGTLDRGHSEMTT